MRSLTKVLIATMIAVSASLAMPITGSSPDHDTTASAQTRVFQAVPIFWPPVYLCGGPCVAGYCCVIGPPRTAAG